MVVTEVDYRGRISPKVQFEIPGIRFSFTLGETENSIAGEAFVVAGGRGILVGQ